ncbi:MAG: dihydropteroate synthase [Lachnospiraceae bacterium]|nr:dihydropteroate synthase [Lachnospiraceae bacterium]
MIIGGRHFDTGNHTYIMGILNVTPDSFSDGGRWNTRDSILYHVEEMIADGADIIDVGGESTRPGYTLLSDSEEIERVAPAIAAIKARFDIPVSIDTYKSEVFKAAFSQGADMLNDIWGLKYDDRLAVEAAKSGVACCLMHNRKEAVYEDYLDDVLQDLKECVDIAKKAGIADNRLILDPGVGFGKTYEQNLMIINHLEMLKKLGYPVLLGTSRKSVIGITLDLPVDERVEGTIATSVIGVMKGCSFIRVHDIKQNKRAVMMTEAVLKS